jgi:glycosyltransferase involved in cell wall biosynthesis
MSLDWLLGPQLAAFQEAGYDVVGMSAPGPHVPHLEQLGVRHEPLPSFTRSNDPFQDMRGFVELVRALRRLRPDILHTHNPKPGILGRIAGRLTGVPLVVNTQHGLYAQPDDTLLRRTAVYGAERLAAAFGHLELVQNEEDVRTLVETLRVPPRKVRLLGNGIDLARFGQRDDTRAARDRIRSEWGIESDQIVCGMVGRLVAEKGVAEILEVTERLSSETDVRFVWIGPTESDKSDAVDAAELARATESGLLLTGPRTDMPECYAAFDLFVTASWREGFPRCVMEASAMGLPTIATDIRGNRQAVRDDMTGVVVPVRNPDRLGAAILDLARDPQRRARLGAGARTLARSEFDQQRVIDRTLAAYRRSPE